MLSALAQETARRTPGRPRAEGLEPNLPPGPRASGTRQSLQWFRDPVGYMERCRSQYGDIFSVRLGRLRRASFISKPEAVREVFKADPDVVRMGPTNALFRPVLGSSSLFLLDGEEHHRHRRLIMPSFHHSHVARFHELTVELTERDLARWPVGEPFRTDERMRSLSLELIFDFVFGVAEGKRRERLRALLVDMLDRVERPLAVLPQFQHELGGRSPFGRVMQAARAIDEILYEEIRERRVDPAGPSHDDVLSMLVQQGPEDPGFLTDEEIRDEVITMLIAGFNTTATATAWAFERLVRHPDVLEQATTDARAGDRSYLRAAIKETLRQRPVLPITARKLAAPMELAGYVFPERWTVMPCMYLLHHEPSLYPEPESFRPERFLDDPPEAHAWAPFGAGVRHCVGTNLAFHTMEAILATILPQVRLRAPFEEPEPIQRRNFTLSPGRGGMVVVLGPRTQTQRFKRAEARVPAAHPDRV
ncbi:MAG: cytochrome P450 [Solirubrobacterales bacterium]